MSILAEFRELFVCPIHQSKLRFDRTVDLSKGVPLPDSKISCPKGCVFVIEKSIPRFVLPNNYSSSFGVQWQKYQRTQLDSYTGTNISRRRLEKSLDMPLDMLKGKVVLEAGCGAGRFTELLIENCELLVSMDISNAVDANLNNCMSKNPYLLIQADINSSPAPPRFFDIVVCLGVIQHTPSPEQTIESLAKHVKPGGLLVIDHYACQSGISALSKLLSLGYPLRAVLKRLKPEISLKVIIALTAICDPIRKRTHKKKWLDRIAARLFPTACYYANFPELDSKILYEWHELDTFDMLTDYYKHFRSPDDIRGCLKKLGFVDINCIISGDIVIARATYPRLGNN